MATANGMKIQVFCMEACRQSSSLFAEVLPSV